MYNIRVIHKDIDSARVLKESQGLLKNFGMLNQTQFSLYSESGNDDWQSGVGRSDGRPFVHEIINKSVKGSYLEELTLRYKNYYRWRLMILAPGRCYSIHNDASDNRDLRRHYRVHIPVQSSITTPLLFFNETPTYDKMRSTCEYYLMEAGNSYLFNANRLHTAINGSNEVRIHLVGQKSVGVS
jgi:hypothetical protein